MAAVVMLTSPVQWCWRLLYEHLLCCDGSCCHISCAVMLAIVVWTSPVLWWQLLLCWHLLCSDVGYCCMNISCAMIAAVVISPVQRCWLLLYEHLCSDGSCCHISCAVMLAIVVWTSPVLWWQLLSYVLCSDVGYCCMNISCAVMAAVVNNNSSLPVPPRLSSEEVHHSSFISLSLKHWLSQLTNLIQLIITYQLDGLHSPIQLIINLSQKSHLTNLIILVHLTVTPSGILLAGTELRDSPVRTEFITGSFHWLTMEFYLVYLVDHEVLRWRWSSTSVASQQWSRGRPSKASI